MIQIVQQKVYNVFYLKTCKRCNNHYVDQTTQPVSMNSYIVCNVNFTVPMFSPLVAMHFNSVSNCVSDFSFMRIHFLTKKLRNIETVAF